jgi:hypothetical protein
VLVSCYAVYYIYIIINYICVGVMLGGLQMMSNGHPPLLLSYCRSVRWRLGVGRCVLSIPLYAVFLTTPDALISSIHLFIYREYWDGANISPLTVSDRNQLLGVYERWDIEDFDVVALAYSPVPITLLVRCHLQTLLSSFILTPLHDRFFLSHEYLRTIID